MTEPTTLSGLANNAPPVDQSTQTEPNDAAPPTEPLANEPQADQGTLSDMANAPKPWWQKETTGISPEIQNAHYKALDKFKSVDDLVQSYSNAVAKIGASPEQFVVRPKADATPEERQKFYADLGVPKEAHAYKFDAPENTLFQEEQMEQIKTWAHKANLLPEQAEIFMKEMITSMDAAANQSIEEAKKEIETSRTRLKEEWGPAFADKLGEARLVADHLGGEEFVKLLDNDPVIGNNPVIWKALAAANDVLANHGITPKGSTPSTNQMTTAQLKDAIRNDTILKNDLKQPREVRERASQNALRNQEILFNMENNS